MKDNKIIISPVFFIITGLVVSALLGIAEWQLLFEKTIKYRESMLWKYTIIFYVFTMAYTYWRYFSDSCLPIFLNLFKWVGINLILSIPYFIILICTETVSMNAVITILPAQIFFLAAIFIWQAASEVDTELDSKSSRIIIKGFLITSIVFMITGLLNLPKVIALTLGSLSALSYFSLLLFRAKRSIESTSYKKEKK